MGCSAPAPQPAYVYYPPPPVVPPRPPPPPPPPPALKECHIDAHIIDVHSFVTISQKFHNPANVATNALRYNFSVLAGAAICGFEMVRGNGKKVIGIIKEKEIAEKELKAAIAAGHTHALGEELTKDVFSIAIGNLSPNETITVNISYINPLIDDDSSHHGTDALIPQLRFTVPRAYMQRAGQAPDGKILAGVHPTNVPFTMKLSIKQGTQIIDYRTPGYSPTAQWGLSGEPLPDAERKRYLTLTFPSSTSQVDVVVVITANGLGSPRVFIERHPTHDPPMAALALTLVPSRREFERVINMEYIVLVDRSSTMAGPKLEMTQKALNYLLAQLPQRGSYFNIFSYGDRVEPMWTAARAYDDVEVGRAKAYITTMKADFGANKKTSQALEKVFASLPSQLTRPVSIFLLTDGAAWDLKDCVTAVEAAIRTRSTPQNFMRVFTVGLGDGVSTDTCDGIARAGKGFATYIVTAEQSFLGKTVRLVLAARTPPVTGFKIFWENEERQTQRMEQAPPQAQHIQIGPAFQSQSLSSTSTGGLFGLLSTGGNQRSTLSNTPTVYDDRESEQYILPRDVGPPMRARQAPAEVPFLNASRTSVFAIVPLSILTRNDLLKVEIRMASIDLTINMDLPVSFLDHSQGKTFLNTLAAKALISDLEHQHLTATATSPVSVTDLKQDIIFNGLKYGLTSRFTSYLAVDDGRPVGIANDVFGTTSVIPRRLPATEIQLNSVAPVPFQMALASFEPNIAARTLSFDSAPAPAQDPDDPAILFELSGLLTTNGDFGANAAKAIGLVLPFCPAGAVQKLEGYNGDMLAALLAWLWMTLWCGIEAKTVVEKIDAWIRKTGTSLDVDALQRELYQVSLGVAN